MTFDDRENAGRIAWVTFNNLKKQNTLSLAGKDLLAEILTDLKHDDGLCAVRVQKRLIIDRDRMSPTDGARAGIQAFVDCYRTDEPKRMMTAFMNCKGN